MRFILIGIIRFIYVAITGAPATMLCLLYAAGGGDVTKFLNAWLEPVYFNKGDKNV